MNWEEVHRLCLEKRLEDEERLKAALLVDLELQDRQIEGIRAELRKLDGKKEKREGKMKSEEPFIRADNRGNPRPILEEGKHYRNYPLADKSGKLKRN